MDNNFKDLVKIPDSSAVKNFEQTMRSPEMQNYMAQQAQQQIMQNIAQPITEVEFRNPNEKTELLLEEANDKYDKQITLLEEKLKSEKASNSELQSKLDDAYIQLRQLNDKTASQNLYIKELKADLKEEMERRIKTEDKLSSKDFKLSWISLIVSIVGGVIAGYFLCLCGV